MQDNRETCRKIAERLYDLDGAVYECVGSTLGRTFTGQRDNTIRRLTEQMYRKPSGHLLRSEMALVSNMARTIKNKELKSKMMTEYNDILMAIEALPDTFGHDDIIDIERAQLNTANLHQKFSKNDHTVICIGRAHGSAGNDIGFALADSLKINYYDEEIFGQLLQREDVELGMEKDSEVVGDFDKYKSRFSWNPKKWIADFDHYHGLPKNDALFFRTAELIREIAKKEDCVIMGRAADLILKNSYIPHISIFINAPFEMRVHRLMKTKNMNHKAAVHFLKKMDKKHARFYGFYAGAKWGHSQNYDLCINSSSYGIEETVDVIARLIQKETR